MDHGIVDVFAFQEALLVMAVFGIAILVMIWAGFRRWLQYKEKMGRLLADETAGQVAHQAAQMERVDARLKAVEQIVTDGGAKLDALATHPLPGPGAAPRS